MIHLILKLLMFVSGACMYIKGETKTKLLGDSKKEFKYAMGIPIGILWAIDTLSWWGLLPILTYFIACEIGYGDNNPLTKLVGKRWAITIHGTCVGLASAPMLHYWSVIAGIISGLAFYYIAKLDDEGKVKEPRVAIARAIGGLCLIPFC